MEDWLGAYSSGTLHLIRTLHCFQHTFQHWYTLTRKYCQLFLGTVVGYSDGQAYGFAALFGLVEDLKLFTATVVDGHLVLDTSKYQLTSGITSVGGAAVSMRKHPSIEEETLTTHPTYYRHNICFYSRPSSYRQVSCMALCWFMLALRLSWPLPVKILRR